MIKRIPLLSVVVGSWLGCTSPLAAAQVYPAISIQGDVYPNTCDARSWQELAGQITVTVKDRSSKQAIQLLRALLCGRGPEAERLVLAHMPQRLLSSWSSTGEENGRELVDRSAEVMRHGEVWGASIVTDADDLTVSHWANEACMSGVTLRFVVGHWMLVAVSTSCD